MYYKSKKISLIILGITALVCSRVMFFFFNDPEGPNLLVVTVMAAIIYFLSLAIYLFNPKVKSIFQCLSFSSLAGLKRLFTMIFIQIIIVTTFYFSLS